MQEIIIPTLVGSDGSDSQKLLSYIEELRMDTDVRLTYIEKQLDKIKQMTKGGETQ